MNQNPLKELEALGQSIWMDYLRRGVITSGQLQRWIDEDGVSGVTSNPTIFEEAIVESQDYDDAIAHLRGSGKDSEEMYGSLTVEDIQQTADIFRPIYERTQGGDGFVSLEVSPHLARDTEGSVREARHLWRAVNRPNVMIKIPGTAEGLPAIRQALSEGININITLLFGLPRYREVIDAYLSALESRVERDLSINNVASVASFFLSRIDVLVDPMLEKILQSSDAEKAQIAQKLHGQIAIASAKIAYQILESAFQGQRFQKLAARGARRQRVLWASTSTKNPKYSDIKYVEPLIGPYTINTVPVKTLDAYRDHGNPAIRVKDGVDLAHQQMELLAELGINIDAITQQLEVEGVEKFSKSYDKLLDRLTEKVKKV